MIIRQILVPISIEKSRWICIGCIMACPHKGAWLAETLAGNYKTDITGEKTTRKLFVYWVVCPPVKSSLYVPVCVQIDHAHMYGQVIIYTQVSPSKHVEHLQWMLHGLGNFVNFIKVADIILTMTFLFLYFPNALISRWTTGKTKLYWHCPCWSDITVEVYALLIYCMCILWNDYIWADLKLFQISHLSLSLTCQWRIHDALSISILPIILIHVLSMFYVILFLICSFIKKNC